MSWTALVPLKAAGARKQRLGERLAAAERDHLAETMARHVLRTLRGCAMVSAVVVLAERPPAGWAGGWLADRGGGLNAELEAARARLDAACLLVLHADLPWLAGGDVQALLAAAEAAGTAIAPDAHGMGTNALAALRGDAPPFRFGAGSFARHRADRPDAAIVRRAGLADDLDTPADLDAAQAVLSALQAA